MFFGFGLMGIAIILILAFISFMASAYILMIAIPFIGLSYIIKLYTKKKMDMEIDKLKNTVLLILNPESNPL